MHDPRYQFDCGRCRYCWDCGPVYQCLLPNIPLHRTPERRILAVIKTRCDAGHVLSADKLLRDWEKSSLEVVAEVMES